MLYVMLLYQDVPMETKAPSIVELKQLLQETIHITSLYNLYYYLVSVYQHLQSILSVSSVLVMK